MNTAIVTISKKSEISDLIRTFLDGRSPHTLTAYGWA